MAEEQVSFDIYQPFGASILKTKLPQVYVDALNKQSDDILNDEEKVAIKNEIKILNKLSHPNIIRIYESYESDLYYHIVMDICKVGDLN